MHVEWIDGALLAAAIPPLAATSYLAALALASRRGPPPRYASTPIKFDVIVPAHDEEAGIAATVASLLAVAYPASLRRVIVVADNCTDATAERARAAGATVLVRDDPGRRGKGYALAYAFERALADGFASAVVVVDADSVVSPNLLEAFAARIDLGASAVQADNTVANPLDSWRTALMAVAFASFNTVRSLGRDRLGLSVGLRGNGMCIALRTLRAVPHDVSSVVEDLEYGIRLGRAGHRVHLAHEARVSSAMVSAGDKARSQRLRWEGGRRRLARAQALSLLAQGVARRSAILLDLGLDLLVPPLAWLGAVAAAGTVAAAIASVAAGRILPAAWAWAAALAGIALHVLRGWWVSGTGLAGGRALLRAPIYFLWKLGLSAADRRGASERWIRTEREKIVSVPQGIASAGLRADAEQLRHMWLALLRQRWTSLAVVAADVDTPTVAIPAALADLPPLPGGEVRVRDARGASRAELERLARELAQPGAEHARTVVLLGSVADRLEGVPLALAVDAILVVVRVGATSLAAARDLLALLGRERVIGTVAVADGALAADPPPAGPYPMRAGAAAASGAPGAVQVAAPHAPGPEPRREAREPK